MKLKQIRVDGYKNLIDCVVNLGDFNVLVGPNNSGKSNLLEVFDLVGSLCFGNDEMRAKLFNGATPRFPSVGSDKAGSSLCNLDAHKNKPMTIGITYEKKIEDQFWQINYEMKLQCAPNDLPVTKGFEYEKLSAKPDSQSGPVTTYLKRSSTEFTIKDKKMKIDRMISSLSTIKVLFPTPEDLPEYMESFIEDIKKIFSNLLPLTLIYSSPFITRIGLVTEPEVPTNFGLLAAIDKLYLNKEHYKLFEQVLIDILDFEDAKFFAEEHKLPAKNGNKETVKRFRSFAIKQKGGGYSEISNFSDGTLTVASLLTEFLSPERGHPLFCWEEPENHLHPAALEKLIRFLQDNADKWPVLLTTHSSCVLNLVNPADVNVAVVDETGATHFEKITDRRKINAILNNKFMSFGDELANNFEDLLKTKKD